MLLIFLGYFPPSILSHFPSNYFGRLPTVNFGQIHVAQITCHHIHSILELFHLRAAQIEFIQTNNSVLFG